MAIRQVTTRQEISDMIEADVMRLRRAILGRLAAIGEQCINAMRTNGSYTDRTGNLRSSVGYVVAENGLIVKLGSFDKVGNATDGMKEGRSLAESLAQQFNSGLVLILVAGMSYAAHVARLGYDVIDSGELVADSLVPKLLEKLKKS